MSEVLTRVESASKALWADVGWKAVVAAFALNGLLFSAWVARVPAFKDGFDLQAGTLGILLLALAGGAIIAFPFAGALSERWGADRLTIRCTWAYAPALVLLALAPNIRTLGFALFVFGAAHGAMDVAMNGWGALVEKRLERNTMPVFHAMFSLGAGLGVGSGYAAVTLGFDPLLHFCIVACLGLGTATLFLRVAGESSEAQAALGFAVFSTTMVVTRLAGGIIVQRSGPVTTTLLSGATALLGLGIVIAAKTLTLALLGFALVGLGYAIVMPLVFSRAANDPSMRPGPAIASVATLGYGGMLLGPPIVGFIAQITDLRMSFGALALLAILTIFLASCLRQK